MTASNHVTTLDVALAAREDRDSVTALTRDLVAIPSRGGIDPYQPIIDHLGGWLREHQLPVTVLTDETGAAVGLTCEIVGARPGPRWVLDACLDTAPFGDETIWTHPPTSAAIDGNWLHGRGSADSKSGAAIFSHIAARLATITGHLAGRLVLLFDLDEHTGGFGGAKRYFEGPDAPRDVAGVMIGYPGMDKLVIGGRGVHRVQLRVHGVASHSGGRHSTPNAITKAADLITALSAAPLPADTAAAFPLPGKLTVTAVVGGDGYSVTPDLCTLHVDLRTTPTFDDAAAARHLTAVLAKVDARWSGTHATEIQVETRWPPYALPHDAALRTALLQAATAACLTVDARIAGPSNIGNYLAGLGIPATAGFGVEHTGLHANDERIRLDTIPAVMATYHHAVLTLMTQPGHSDPAGP